VIAQSPNDRGIRKMKLGASRRQGLGRAGGGQDVRFQALDSAVRPALLAKAGGQQ
jgi:hypothetical protein